MNPAFQASQVYKLESCVNTFYEDVDYYLAHGFVHSTPEYFVMARPVCSQWSHEWIVNPVKHEGDILKSDLTSPPDVWHIALMAGNIQAAWSQFPYMLPLISMERKNKLKIYDHARFRRILLRGE